MSKKLDYTKIKEEFKNAGVEFAKSDEVGGLNEKELMEINPCGTYCGTCEDYGVVCDGCRNREGSPLWYKLFGKKETCCYYSCAQNNQYHNCSQCKNVPCDHFFEYPDPNMTDEFKQMWFKLRMENFNKINQTKTIDIKDTYPENETLYKGKKSNQ